MDFQEPKKLREKLNEKVKMIQKRQKLSDYLGSCILFICVSVTKRWEFNDVNSLFVIEISTIQKLVARKEKKKVNSDTNMIYKEY